MTGRLAATFSLLVALAVGFVAGRALGTDETTAATTTTTTTTTTTVAGVRSPVSTAGPTLSELVPGLEAPLFLETGTPTQLLRWDPDAPAPVPVRNLPAGTDLTMDRDGRFLFLSMPGSSGQLLLGGLADTPPAVFSERMTHFPAFAEFSDRIWFLEGDDLVAMTTWGDEQFRGPWRPEVPEDVVVEFASAPVLEAADDAGAVIRWYFLPEGGEVVFTRTFISRDGRVALPPDPEAMVAGFDEDHVVLRTEIGALVAVDKATGESEDVPYDGSCGRAMTSSLGVRASVCGGVAIVLTDPPIIDVGSWSQGRWTTSGDWFMAVSGSLGEVLLIDLVDGVAHQVAVPLPGGTTLLDVWSGA